MFKSDFLYKIDIVWICLIFFLSILIMGYLGKKAGNIFHFRKGQDDQIDGKSIKSMEAGLIGLFSLLIGFTFHFTATRYNSTKTVVIDEANDLGIAIIMADLYKPEDKAIFIKNFRIYLEAAIAYYDAEIDQSRKDQLIVILHESGNKIWQHSSQLSHDKDYHMASKNMIPALKDMFKSAYQRQAIINSRMPDMIFIMLYIVSVTCVFVSGYTTRKSLAKERLLVFGFAAVSTLVLFIILDYDRPSRGLITDSIGKETMIEKRKLLE